jgi:hypothetical protein
MAIKTYTAKKSLHRLPQTGYNNPSFAVKLPLITFVYLLIHLNFKNLYIFAPDSCVMQRL